MKLRSNILIALLIVSLFSCNKESYIESVGKVMLEDGDETAVGHYIITSKKAAGTCGSVAVYIDDKLLGELTGDNTATITCETQPVEGKILRVVVPAGTHKVSVKYQNNCMPDVSKSFAVQQGKCFWVTLD